MELTLITGTKGSISPLDVFPDARGNTHNRVVFLLEDASVSLFPLSRHSRFFLQYTQHARAHTVCECILSTCLILSRPTPHAVRIYVLITKHIHMYMYCFYLGTNPRGIILGDTRGFERPSWANSQRTAWSSGHSRLCTPQHRQYVFFFGLWSGRHRYVPSN